MHDRRRRAFVVVALILTLVAIRHPTADLKLMTHDAGDPAPHRIQAAIDLGLVGVSFVYTWSRRLG